MFTLSLFPPDDRRDTDVTVVVRVPKAVIEHERPQTWAEDLRVELASWIGNNMIEGGQIVWWPPPPDRPRLEP